ncbi:MAG TPA: tRNA (adenosine(37)-N6)-threonylcarbamoyltransferase complex dimerization subunit type 1 TsaB [Xanthobacteraceae bacterium]|jgi:tRNA threonylcarbamoyladenosine biosynthesis protein TsaB|nr:tRNA (adenosine(37)-N6)-threonylcarbamoyltransferase complex dimerization subunit type 1 TsaB [Xanthobacteraceae bacterium]
MRVLAIDTALGACSAAVFDSKADEIFASESIAMSRGHAEALMPLVARVMDHATLSFHDLDRIAVTVGPGSFTGLRVGISAARGIALAAGKPAVGISTLSAFAVPSIARGATGNVVSAIDARHDHVYLQVFGIAGEILIPAQIISIPETIRSVAIEPAILVGSAATVLEAEWPPDAPRPQVEASAAPDIAWVARLGAAAEVTEALPKPFYLRLPDARPQDAARLPRR